MGILARMKSSPLESPQTRRRIGTPSSFQSGSGSGSSCHCYGVAVVISLLVVGVISQDAGNALSIIPPSGNRVYQKALGKSSIFTCNTNVEAPERLTEFKWWWPDGKAIEATDSRVEIMRDQPGSLTLLFTSIQEQDLGTYKCTALYANTQQLSIDFTLKAYVPITFEDAPIQQYAVKGEDYKVKCKVRADPGPQVDWKKDHRVINNSAQAVVHNEAGQVLHFPPRRGGGGLPRAITFSDWSGPRPSSVGESENQCQINHKTERSEDYESPALYSYLVRTMGNQCSFMVTSNESKLDIEDPPEAYESFELDCSSVQPSKSEEFHLNDGIPCVSTPTEQYSNILKQKYSQQSPQPRSPLPSGSEGSCPASPLIQTGSTAYLSLDELVEIYTKKMEAARKARAKAVDDNDLTDEKHLPDDECNMDLGLRLAKDDQQSQSSQNYQRPGLNEEADLRKRDVTTDLNTSCSKTPLQLMAFDIQLLLQKLNGLFERDDSQDEDMLFVSLEEYESLLASCCRDADNSTEWCSSR